MHKVMGLIKSVEGVIGKQPNFKITEGKSYKVVYLTEISKVETAITGKVVKLGTFTDLYGKKQFGMSITANNVHSYSIPYRNIISIEEC